jgi:hypothetical protein
MGIGGPFPGGKRLDREFENSPPSSADVKNFYFLLRIYFSPLAPTLEHRADFSVSLIILQTVGLLGRVIASSQDL